MATVYIQKGVIIRMFSCFNGVSQIVVTITVVLGVWFTHGNAATDHSDIFQVKVRTDVIHLNDVISTVNSESSRHLIIDHIELNGDRAVITYTGYGRQTGEYDFANVFEYQDGEFHAIKTQTKG